MKKYVAILLLCVCVLTLLCGVMAYAETTEYSDALTDLQRDQIFSIADYPSNSKDYSLQVIQVAESVHRELFVYVYQPCTSRDLTATTVRLSTGVNNNAYWLDYKLEKLNQTGVFVKYRVLDLTVSDDAVRYYDIAAIHRKWNEEIDEGTDNGNKIDEIVFDVSKRFTLCTLPDGTVTYNCKAAETITVTDMFVGFVRYPFGFSLSPVLGTCDAHFVAFDTDRPIDKLMEATVAYVSQYYWMSQVSILPAKTTFNEKEEHVVDLKAEEVSYSTGGWFAETYTWNRIETVEQFIAEEDRKQIHPMGLFDVVTKSTISDEGMKNLEDKKWVLRFTETSYSVTSNEYGYSESWTIIGSVTILRLKFETEGVVYNLGVVSNKQTGSGKPINDIEQTLELSNRGINFLLVVFGVILGVLVIWLIVKIVKLCKHNKDETERQDK